MTDPFYLRIAFLLGFFIGFACAAVLVLVVG